MGIFSLKRRSEKSKEGPMNRSHLLKGARPEPVPARLGESRLAR